MESLLNLSRLVITLQYLSQGTSMQMIAWTFHVGLNTIHKIIYETCTVIWNMLHKDYLKTPTTEKEWLKIAEGFYERWNFPHCLGAVDGKHIQIEAPAHISSLFFNYKKHFSIVLMASSDSEYKFTFVDIGAYGSQSDGGIFKLSVFSQMMEENSMNIPRPRYLPYTNIEMPYFLVVDEAYPLKEYIMRPYPGKNLTPTHRVFNYRLSRARRIIENSFGILSARWRILKSTINAKVENIDNIVKACVTLHNYCQIEFQNSDLNLYCPAGYADSVDEPNGMWREEGAPMSSVGRIGANVATRAAYRIRDTLASYFTSDVGLVLWQNKLLDLQL